MMSMKRVGEEGLEPSRSYEQQLLKLPRLPTSPLARRSAYREPRGVLERGIEFAQARRIGPPLVQAAHRTDPHRDRAGVTAERAQRTDRLLTLIGVLRDVRGEAMQSEPHIDLDAVPHRRSREVRFRDLAERGIRLGATGGEAGDQVQRAARGVRRVRLRPPLRRHEDWLAVGASDRVLHVRPVRALDLDGVDERLAERPLAFRGRAVQQRVVESTEQTAQLAECALREREDPRGLDPFDRRLRGSALLFLEGVIERVAVPPLPAERPPLARELRVRERRERRERGIEGHDLTRASMPESRSMTLMIARLPSRPPPSRWSAL